MLYYEARRRVQVVIEAHVARLRRSRPRNLTLPIRLHEKRGERKSLVAN